MFEAVILKLQGLMTPICYIFISVMINEDISCLRLVYLLQIMVETINETAIYHIKILARHKKAPNTFYKILNIPLEINSSMHGNDENILC